MPAVKTERVHPEKVGFAYGLRQGVGGRIPPRLRNVSTKVRAEKIKGSVKDTREQVQPRRRKMEEVELQRTFF